MIRRNALLLGATLLGATWSLLACRPTPTQPDLGQVGDPAPPEAPILQTLTDYGVVEGDARAGVEALPEGAVLSASPTGHASPTEPVVVWFSTPMRDDVSNIEVAIEPHVGGTAKWTSPTRLTFQPDHAFGPARSYVVQISGSATTLAGTSVPIDQRLTFETPRPTAEVQADYAGYEGDERDRVSWKAGFSLLLSSHATEAQVRDALSVTRPGKGTLPYRLVAEPDHPSHTYARRWRVLPRGHWPADATIEASLSAALTTLDGPLPTGERVFATMRTRPGVKAEIDCDDSAKDGCVIGGFTLRFDAPLPVSAAEKIALTPRPKHFEARPWTWREDATFDSMTFFGEFEAGRTYTLKIGNVRDVEGQSLAGSHRRELRFVAPPPILEFRGDGTQLSSRGGMVGVETRSLEDATLVVSTLDDRALAAVVQQQAQREGDEPLTRPHRGIETRELPLDLKPGGTWGWDARAFDLTKEFGADTGAAFFELVPGEIQRSQVGRADVDPTSNLVQLTNLGVIVGDSPSGGFVRVLALDTAEPVVGATAHVFGKSFPPERTGSYGPSDARGFIELPKGTKLRGGVVHVVVVEAQDDRVAVALDGTGAGRWRSWNQPEAGAEFDIGVVMPDRELYQPGERMRVMGWTARTTPDNPAGIEGTGTRPVTVELKDHGDQVIARAKVRTKAYGKFWATLDVPEDADLGWATIVATIDGNEDRPFTRGVALREFVAPAFDVTLALDDTELTHGQNTRAVAVARYLHGMPLPVASASTRVSCWTRSYRPVDTDEYRVAYARTDANELSPGWSPLKKAEAHEKGRVSFDVDLAGLTAGHPYACNVSLLTMDAARQEISTSASAWVHPSRYLLVAPHAASTRVEEPRTIRARAVLPSGASTTAKPAKAIIHRVEADDTRTKTHTCPLKFDSSGEASCTWTPHEPGAYDVRFEGVVDGVKVTNSWGTHVRTPRPKRSDTIPFEVSVPENAAVGDEVDVQVQTPYPDGAGFAVEVHAGIRDRHLFDVRDHAGRFSLKATDAWVPRGYVDTFVVYPDSARSLPQVHESFDDVYIGYDSRALEVQVDNPEVASIGATLPIDVAVTDSHGEAVEDAHVSIWAVDEGILILREWDFPDFTTRLAIDRGNEARYFDGYDELSRPYVLRRDPFEPGGGSGGGSGSGFGRGSGAGHGGRASAGSASKPQTRRNFDPAPIFIGDVKTGPDGTARVQGVLPDNLTTFRIAAVATAEVPGTGAFARAGRDESRVRVTQDLSIRPVLPRVLRPGDAAQLGVLVDNLIDAPGELSVEVELRDATGVAKITSASTVKQRLDGPQVRIPIDVEALRPGAMTVWVTARLETDDGRTLQDASELPLEVEAERTLVRHAATYGSMVETPAGAIALAVPPHIPASAEASVDVYASMLGGYKGAVDDLVTYPYGCVEQTSSRLVPLAALHGLREFDLGIESVETFIRAGVARLEAMKTRQGGFAYWPGGTTPHVYATAYATWVLSELKRSGIKIDDVLLSDAADFLDAELALVRSRATPTTYEDVRAAMALLAITSVGRSNPAVMDALLDRTGTLPAFARALLAMALHEVDPADARLPALLDGLRERIELRDATARAKAESKRYTEFFDSPLRTDAMLLLALVRTAPDDPLIEPLARGLTEARDRGELRNTQENAYALLAMSGYTALRESVEPDMDVRAWIGPDMVLETAFEGRDLSVLRAHTTLQSDDPLVTLQREGEGRLYYRVGMQWAPKLETIEARGRGITIERTLFDSRGEVEDRALVAGETGTLEVTITADARQRYVAIDVPIPAGIETIDTSLGRGGVSTFVPGSGGGAGLRYNHHELRDDRVVVFADHLPAGTYRYRVPIRATHEGDYSMPPATVHAMYAPEIAGNTTAARVRVVSP